MNKKGFEMVTIVLGIIFLLLVAILIVPRAVRTFEKIFGETKKLKPDEGSLVTVGPAGGAGKIAEANPKKFVQIAVSELRYCWNQMRSLRAELRRGSWTASADKIRVVCASVDPSSLSAPVSKETLVNALKEFDEEAAGELDDDWEGPDPITKDSGKLTICSDADDWPNDDDLYLTDNVKRDCES